MRVSQILVSTALAGLLLAGCGQRGPLYLPTGEEAAGRATLPQTLSPSRAAAPANASSAPAAATPPTGTAAPVRTP
ncbi:LPS translocon maturation chaperone LptM [Ramlibacter pallidus]|uniref:Lipoprotein n=1 Tax=Ramlibacter pallidus TaxID=2780087 RepID=A0ABR9RYP1_9BURK|nr:lipoprotein [Ramlibacter pallidus]MBE7366358.1 lipoprotein [Ramlibacter pallidus]